MKLILAADPRRVAIGQTFLRVVTGFIFAMHGYQKLFGMGFSGVSGAFGHMGAPLPGLTGPLFAVCEFFLGIAVILGFLTRLGALWFIIDMIGAIAVVHIRNGWSARGGLEFPVLLLAASIVVFLGGPGRFALDGALAARRAGSLNT